MLSWIRLIERNTRRDSSDQTELLKQGITLKRVELVGKGTGSQIENSVVSTYAHVSDARTTGWSRAPSMHKRKPGNDGSPTDGFRLRMAGVLNVNLNISSSMGSWCLVDCESLLQVHCQDIVS